MTVSSISLIPLLAISVRTPRDLSALATRSYLIAAVVALGFLVAAAITANAITYEGGPRPADPGKRRLSFWALGVTATVGFLGYAMLVLGPSVAANLQPRFMRATAIGAAEVFAVYVVVGFVISKIFATGKVGNWFSSGR
jgi:sulfoxide reductase heme-binding subunit YedZ